MVDFKFCRRQPAFLESLLALALAGGGITLGVRIMIDSLRMDRDEFVREEAYHGMRYTYVCLTLISADDRNILISASVPTLISAALVSGPPVLADAKFLADALLVAVVSLRGGSSRTWAQALQPRPHSGAGSIDLKDNPDVTPLWTDRTSRGSWDREAMPLSDMGDTASLLTSAPPSTFGGGFSRSQRSAPSTTAGSSYGSAPSNVVGSSHRSRGKHAEAMAEAKEDIPPECPPMYSEGSSEAAKYYAAAAELIERARQTESESQQRGPVV